MSSKYYFILFTDLYLIYTNLFPLTSNSLKTPSVILCNPCVVCSCICQRVANEGVVLSSLQFPWSSCHQGPGGGYLI